MADGGVPLDADGDGEVDGAREADLRQGQQDGHQVGVPVDTPDPGNQCSAVDTEMWSDPESFKRTFAKFAIITTRPFAFALTTQFHVYLL